METEKKIFEIEELLKSNGYKLTHPREVIVRLFVQTSEHLKPEDIYNKVRNEDVSIPTGDRSIEIFKKIGIIKEVVINNERYYELSIFSQKKFHSHFQCSVCGKIKEDNDRRIFKDMLMQRDYIEETYNDVIDDVTVVMRGVCSSCKKDVNVA
uniref:Fur protein n=1 Tax=Peptoclostridium acidaminophilum TaxID=1731 RepID=Q9L3Q2_PEPAC|nr:Fur protein [Peptoclostridium acidaminophilum DSM 3953]